MVVLSSPPTPPTDRLKQMMSDNGISMTFLGGRGIGSAPFVCRRMQHWLRDCKPDLLHCLLAHANVLGAVAGHQSGVPHIVTGIQVAEQRRTSHLALQRRTARFVEKHICVSRSVADFAAREMRLPREKLVVIPNGIDVDRFVGAKPIGAGRLGVHSSRRLLLFAGRLDPQKWPDWLLERMPDIFQRLPGHDLVIAGEGPMKDSLRRLAARLNVAERVHFVGWQSDVPRLLAASDMVLLTSRWEGMPNILLEAMAAARPIVTTDVHGARELLGSAVQLQITPQADSAAFVDAVVRIGSDSALAARLGGQNRERAASDFSMNQMIAAYIKLYDSMLGLKN
jgi:glycosyltransferase involved in cell wall biosynthesis